MKKLFENFVTGGVSAQSPMTPRSDAPAPVVFNHTPFTNSFVVSSPSSPSLSPNTTSRSIDENCQDVSIVQAVEGEDIVYSLGMFRSSESVKKVVNTIIELSLAQSLAHCWSKQSVYVRLAPIKELLVIFLSIPTLSSLAGVGKYFNIDQSLDNSLSEKRLISSLKYLISDLLTFFKVAEENLLEHGNDTQLDIRRRNIAINLITFRLSSLVPFILTITEYTPIVLTCLTCHLLGTRAIAEDIKNTIHRVVNTIKGKLGDDILNKSLKDCVRILVHYIDDYFHWIRENREALEKECQNADIVASVNPSVRAWLKGEEYSSPNEIISSYHQKYKKYLSMISIPLRTFNSQDIEQGIKDIAREKIVLNQQEYAGSCSLEVIKTEIDKLLTFISGAESSRTSPVTSTKRTSSIEKAVELLRNDLSSDDNANSGASEATAFSFPEIATDESASQVPLENKHYEMRNKLVDMLLNNVLVSISRTASGGDAFFILEDLYGGDGLILCPANRKVNPSITASAFGMKIVLQDDYSLYNDITYPPLMHFKCTTVTTIQLNNESIDTAKIESYIQCFMQSPEKMINRYVTIEPRMQV